MKIKGYMGIKKGMYVRDFFGIDQVEDIVLVGNLYEDSGLYLKHNGKIHLSKDYMNKMECSNDILDLIKPQDLMYIDIGPHDGHGGIVVPRVAETQNELNKYLEQIKKDEHKLFGVLTLEMINNNLFEVEYDKH